MSEWVWCTAIYFVGWVAMFTFDAIWRSKKKKMLLHYVDLLYKSRQILNSGKVRFFLGGRKYEFPIYEMSELVNIGDKVLVKIPPASRMEGTIDFITRRGCNIVDDFGHHIFIKWINVIEANKRPLIAIADKFVEEESNH